MFHFISELGISIIAGDFVAVECVTCIFDKLAVSMDFTLFVEVIVAFADTFAVSVPFLILILLMMLLLILFMLHWLDFS